MNRRRFVFALAAAAAAFGQETPKFVSIGAIEVPGPKLPAVKIVPGKSAAPAPKAEPKQPAPKKGLIDKAKGIGSGIKEVATQAVGLEKFAHLFVKISDGYQNFYLHGLPLDEKTGERREFGADMTGSILRVVAMTDDEHKEFVAKATSKIKNPAVIASVPIEDSKSRSATELAAVVLDAGLAINESKMPYKDMGVDKAPTADGNAAVASMVSRFGFCGDVGSACVILPGQFKGYTIAGVGRPLLKADIDPVFDGLAKHGRSLTSLVSIFNEKPVAVETKPATPADRPALVAK